ncbi:T-complex protein 1 subunit theta, partial [Tanacetum coccineum]
MLIFSLSKQPRQGNKKQAQQGNKNLSGLYQAVIKNIDACKELSTITRTSLGPYAKLLVLAAKEHQKKLGDGANLVVSIAGQHLKGAKELITMGLNPSEIINGYKKASNKLGEILETLVEEGSETMDVRNKDQVILCMKAPVSSKLYDMEDVVCPLIAD